MKGVIGLENWIKKNITLQPSELEATATRFLLHKVENVTASAPSSLSGN